MQRSYPVEVDGGESRIMVGQSPSIVAQRIARTATEGAEILVWDTRGWRRRYEVRRRSARLEGVTRPEDL